jgi:shikimate dehydrogenase
MGNPIAHSLSPVIHAAFAARTRQRLNYQAFLVEPGAFSEAVRRFRMAGGKGLNVTIPFKEEAWTLAERRSPRAQLAGAVNTLGFEPEGGIWGDNTDGVGFVRDYVINHQGRIEGSRVLILGAGGAVRGVIEPILAEHPARIVIANRTVAKAAGLCSIFRALGPIEASGFDGLAGRQFDLIINGTAASLQGRLPPLPDDLLAEGGCCYDMMYRATPTPFVRWGQTHGAAQSVDGLGMLVEQAAESFHLWRGVRPETAPVIAMLRKRISN